MTTLLPISNVRTHLPDLVHKVNKYLDRITITINGHPKAVLISEEELTSLEETAEILEIPGVKESIARGLKQAKKGQVRSLEDILHESPSNN